MRSAWVSGPVSSARHDWAEKPGCSLTFRYPDADRGSGQVRDSALASVGYVWFTFCSLCRCDSPHTRLAELPTILLTPGQILTSTAGPVFEIRQTRFKGNKLSRVSIIPPFHLPDSISSSNLATKIANLGSFICESQSMTSRFGLFASILLYSPERKCLHRRDQSARSGSGSHSGPGPGPAQPRLKLGSDIS